MLKKISFHTARGLSTLGRAALFVVMLPVTLAAMVIMMLVGLVALANLRHRLRQSQTHAQWKSVDGSEPFEEVAGARPPIEGIYTVVQK